ncbi:DMT family transporter [Roseibium sp.]|uniref:DMT family transporter n=1 Tax=Roseibium sp. TaxID=1936156 RepID=UPI003D14B7C4
MPVKNLEIKYLEIKINVVIYLPVGGTKDGRPKLKGFLMTDTVRSAGQVDGEPARSNAGSLDSRGLLQQPLVLLLIVGGFLAVSTIIAKAAPSFGWHPLVLLQWSILGGAAALFAATRVSTGKARPHLGQVNEVARRKLLTYLVFSGLLFIAPNMIAVVAASKVGAGFVSLSYAFPLVLTYALAVVLRLERFRFLMGTGVLFGLFGGVLLALSGAELSVEASWWAVFALFIPVFLATGNIYRTLHWPKGAKPVDLALGMMATGFVALAIFTAALGLPLAPADWTWQATGLAVAQMAIFALQYGLYFRLQQTAGPVYLSQIGSVAAVIGLGLGFAVFGEIPNLAKLAAVAAVGIGIVLVTVGRKST